jgi:hypothetical protein
MWRIGGLFYQHTWPFLPRHQGQQAPSLLPSRVAVHGLGCGLLVQRLPGLLQGQSDETAGPPGHAVPVPQSRFSHIHVDFVDPLPESSKGYLYLFTGSSQHGDFFMCGRPTPSLDSEAWCPSCCHVRTRLSARLFHLVCLMRPAESPPNHVHGLSSTERWHGGTGTPPDKGCHSWPSQLFGLASTPPLGLLSLRAAPKEDPGMFSAETTLGAPRPSWPAADLNSATSAAVLGWPQSAAVLTSCQASLPTRPLTYA